MRPYAGGADPDMAACAIPEEWYLMRIAIEGHSFPYSAAWSGLFERLVHDRGELGLFYLAGFVVQGFAALIENGDVRDVAAIKLLQQFLLRSRPAAVQIDNREVHAPFIPFVQGDRAPRLPLGIESALAVNEDGVGLPFYRAVFHAVARDEWAVPAVA